MKVESMKVESAAAKLLKRLKDQSSDVPLLVPVKILGMEFFIRRVSYGELTLLISNIVNDLIATPNATRDQKANTVASRTIVQIVKEKDGKPYFTMDDAKEHFDKPEFTELVATLFIECCRLNPTFTRTLESVGNTVGG